MIWQVLARARSPWSVGIGGVLLLCSLVVGLSLGSLPDGADGANAANYALTTVMFLGPLVAGLTGTLAGQDARGGVHDLARTTPRGRLAAVLVVTLAGLLWGIVAHFAVLSVTLTRATTGLWRLADVSLVVAAWSLLMLCSVAGSVLGSVLTSPRAGLWAAGSSFGLLYAGGYLEAWSARAATLYPGTAYPIFMQPNTGMLAGKSLLAAALAAALLAVLARRGRRADLGLAGVLAAAVTAGVVLVATSPDWPAVAASTGETTCAGRDGFTVCTWPQHADRADKALDALTLLEAEVGDLYPLPRRYREDGTGPARAGEVLIGSLPHPDAPTPTSQLAETLAARTLPDTCPDADAATARAALSQWLYQQTSPFAEPSQAADATVRAWVDQVRRCHH